MEENTLKEGEVVMYYELKEALNCDDDSSVLIKTKLECLNCGFIGTVSGMRVKSSQKSPTDRLDIPDKPDVPSLPSKYKWASGGEVVKQQPEGKLDEVSEKLKKFRNCISPAESELAQRKTIDSWSGLTPYKESFECPKCGSTAITLAEGEIQRLTAEVI